MQLQSTTLQPDAFSTQSRSRVTNSHVSSCAVRYPGVNATIEAKEQVANSAPSCSGGVKRLFYFQKVTSYCALWEKQPGPWVICGCRDRTPRLVVQHCVCAFFVRLSTVSTSLPPLRLCLTPDFAFRPHRISYHCYGMQSSGTQQRNVERGIVEKSRVARMSNTK